MRRLRRSAASESSAPVRALDPSVDPPIVAALLEPIQDLRASLGTGKAVPDATITEALSAASDRAADSEEPHRRGLYALESTWTSGAADLAVPSMRTTQTELGEISDRGPAYLEVLSDAQTTTSRGAAKVDEIIADFRRDARRILGVATASPDVDAVIERGAQALREAIDTVQATRTEMSDHTQRLEQMGPVTVSSPTGVAGYGYGGGIGGSQYAPGATTTVDGKQMDPVQVAQFQLQQQLISAGVELGTAAISAGVDIGTHLIDKIVEVGTHAMDTVAASADKVIEQAIPGLVNPGGASTDSAGAGGTGTKSGTGPFDFGATPGGRGGTAGGPNTRNGESQNAVPQHDPEPALPRTVAPQNPFAGNAPGGTTVTPRVAAPEPAQQHGPTGGVAMPPPQNGGDQDHKSKEGQLGVTVPASADLEPVTVPAAVIGDFGDDFV